MGRLAWSQLRFRTTRLLALLGGMLLATTAFTVLTAAARTSQLRTVGTVSANFAPAYDILVRPRNSRTALEARTDTVQPNFLSGLYGGITMSQWHQIAAVPGVSLAAPIAMVGYTELASFFSYDLPARAYAAPGRQLYRIATTWVSDGGTSRIKQPAGYVYVTPRPLQITSSGATRELLPGGAHADGCQVENVNPGSNPFAPETQAATASDCWSKVNGAGSGSGYNKSGNPGYTVSWEVPVLIAAVDPVAEAKLDGLSRALVSGSYLAENSRDAASGDLGDAFPVLAASSTVTGETAETQLQQLSTPSSPPLMNARWLTREAAVAGRTLATTQTTAQPAYQELLKEVRNKAREPAVWGYWTVGPTSYRPAAHGAVTPLLVRNPVSTVSTPDVTGIAVSVDNEDNQYRAITIHAASGPFTGTIAAPRLVGIFNPAKVKSCDPLSAVPLGAYQPTAAAPANAASSKALHGSDLLPDQNLGGYVSQPADLITTLAALPALQHAGYYGSSVDTDDPISVIRVRVAGVTGPNNVSLERIKEVAQQIEVRTHLDVDIVAGSSPAPTTVDLPAGKYGQPALTLTEDWVKKGVAVAILTAVDKNSVVLFALILIVCVLFVANSASAAVRGRRRELGVLACLGWTRPRLFTSVLGELAAIGLAAGLLGAAAALPLSSAGGLAASPDRAALA